MVMKSVEDIVRRNLSDLVNRAEGSCIFIQ